MKIIVTILAIACLAFTMAQYPCHDYGFNGPISNCASCNILGNVWASGTWFSVCTNCTAGFFLNQSMCMNCTANCVKCTTNGACVSGQCAPGYAFIPSNFTCMACPAALGCLQCTYNNQNGGYNSFNNGPFACTACPNNNYYISTAGACVSCGTAATLNCVGGTGVWVAPGACNANGCLGCPSSGYVNTGVAPVVTCTACSTGCTTCSSASVCSVCGNGYFISGSACVACTPNCISCASTSACNTVVPTAVSTQGSCAAGYYPSTGTTCATCTTTSNVGCNYCGSTTICQAGGCGTGYWFNTVTTFCTACPTNCTSCSANSAGTAALCTGCVANNTLSNGVCYACSNNCTQCATTSSAGTATVCLQCQLGWGLNDTNGTCFKCPPNCDYCDTNGVCTQCRSGAWIGYTAPATALQPAAGYTNSYYAYPVTQGYFLPPNQCQQCPYNCSVCANTTYCYNNCTKNYAYNSTLGLCLPNGAERIFLAGFALLSVIFYFI